MVNISDMMSALIALAVAVLTTFVIPAIRQKMGAEDFAELLKWVKIAVQAAEQSWAGISGSGKQKKEYVQRFLENRGYDLDPDELDAAIESAVLELKGSIADENC